VFGGASGANGVDRTRLSDHGKSLPPGVADSRRAIYRRACNSCRSRSRVDSMEWPESVGSCGLYFWVHFSKSTP